MIWGKMRLRWIVAAAVALLVTVPFIVSVFYLSGMSPLEDTIIPAPPQLSLRATTPRKIQLAKAKSSVDYFACCGLGHRMSKLVDAYYIAQSKNFGLRAFFGFCNETTEVFHHFFGAQPLEELEMVTDQRRSFKINNEAPCFNRFARTGNATECRCTDDYIELNGQFYTRLFYRFRYSHTVESFAQRHDFLHHTVIGLHIRAGNGEQGDFVSKNRAIQNETRWIGSISNIILNISKDWLDKPPLLFIATDTAGIVDDFRLRLSGKIKVVDYEQERAAPGTGVVFGAMGAKQKPQGDECLLHWKNSLIDMMLLAAADVVIAGRPSSFTQSLPMSVVLSRQQRKAQQAYCEVNPDASAFQCFQSMHDWCCRGRTAFHLEGIRGYEYRRLPAVNFAGGCKMDHHLHERPVRESAMLVSTRNQQSKRAFLPYDWDWVERDNF